MTRYCMLGTLCLAGALHPARARPQAVVGGDDDGGIPSAPNATAASTAAGLPSLSSYPAPSMSSLSLVSTPVSSRGPATTAVTTPSLAPSRSESFASLPPSASPGFSSVSPIFYESRGFPTVSSIFSESLTSVPPIISQSISVPPVVTQSLPSVPPSVSPSFPLVSLNVSQPFAYIPITSIENSTTPTVVPPVPIPTSPSGYYSDYLLSSYSPANPPPPAATSQPAVPVVPPVGAPGAGPGSQSGWDGDRGHPNSTHLPGNGGEGPGQVVEAGARIVMMGALGIIVPGVLSMLFLVLT